MLTRLRIRNFKRFRDVEIELGDPVVFIGPNNSGKTTALQALALWDIGVKRWLEKRRGKETPKNRPGVTINRRDLIALPVPDANLLWRDLHVRDVRRLNGKQQTQNIRVDVVVDGVTGGEEWACGMEFDYANEESFYCRPLRIADQTTGARMPVPEAAGSIRVAFLPPMSGLAANETRLDPGAVNVRLGEGRTAEVLRNLCYELTQGDDGQERWRRVAKRIEEQFGVRLDVPKYLAERGEIVMSYRDKAGIRLDLSAAGRGLQQTLLLLTHLDINRGSVLLLDEPDAHLEILRQRQIYGLLTDAARNSESQVIAASHSEVVLSEAAKRDVVVAFLGKPHRIDDRGGQLLKSLGEFAFDQYYQAEQRGWVLYLEGSTDLAILRSFAETLGHPARRALETPFVYYVENQPSKAKNHFYGLREARPDLIGFALFDRLDQPVSTDGALGMRMWQRREIENYLCDREVLLAWAQHAADQPSAPGTVTTPRRGSPRQQLSASGGDRDSSLFTLQWRDVMDESIAEIEQAMVTLGRGSPWDAATKVSDDFLDPLFDRFFTKLGLPNLMRKTNYHQLAHWVPRGQIDPEVGEVLDSIVAAANQAKAEAEE